MTHDQYRLRGAIGIASTEHVLPVDDYWELYQFANVQEYEDFKSACDQVGAAYPKMSVFRELKRREDLEIEKDASYLCDKWLKECQTTQ